MKSINYEELVTKVLNRRNRGTILNMSVFDTTMNWLRLLFMAAEWGHIVLKPSFAVKLDYLIKVYESAKSVDLVNKDLITDDIMDYVQDNHIKDIAKLIRDADMGRKMKPPEGDAEFIFMLG